jgi:hypothetical protein
VTSHCLKRHQVLQKLHIVYFNFDSSLTKEQKKVLEPVDKVCSRKLAMGKVEWSPEIGKAHKMKRLWMAIVHYKSGGKVNMPYIHQKAQRCGITKPLSCTLLEAEQAKKQSIDCSKSLKPKAAKLQKAFLWDKANHHSEGSDGESRKQEKWLLSKEIAHGRWCSIYDEPLAPPATVVSIVLKWKRMVRWCIMTTKPQLRRRLSKTMKCNSTLLRLPH